MKWFNQDFFLKRHENILKMGTFKNGTLDEIEIIGEPYL